MPATPDQVRRAIENYVKAWATNDKKLFLSLFAPDAQWWDPVGTPPFKGLEGVERFWDFAHQDAGRTLEPRIEEIRACGSEGILRFTMQVRIPAKRQALDLVDHRSFLDRRRGPHPDGARLLGRNQRVDTCRLAALRAQRIRGLRDLRGAVRGHCARRSRRRGLVVREIRLARPPPVIDKPPR